jgi:glycosyltransferase involved in cell wall biosynthesis
MRRCDSGIATVLICTFNDEETIAAALESALAQTAPRASYRILVVDDGSTDATPTIVHGYRREGVDVMRLPSNCGLVTACNEGLRTVGAPCFVRLDGDDRFEPELIEMLLEARYMRGADLVFTDRWELHADGRRVHRRLGDPPNVGHLIAAGTLLPTRLVRDLGGYRELFWEEFDLYLRLLESGRCRTTHVPRPLYTYSVGADGRMTSDAVLVQSGWRRLRDEWPSEVLVRHGLDPLKAGAPDRAA